MRKNKVKDDCKIPEPKDIVVKTNRTQEEIEAAIEREKEKMKTMTEWPLM